MACQSSRKVGGAGDSRATKLRAWLNAELTNSCAPANERGRCPFDPVARSQHFSLAASRTARRDWRLAQHLTGARLVRKIEPRRRPVAELWNIRPSRGSIGEGETALTVVDVQAIS